MKKLKEYWLIVLLGFFALAFLFYWYEFRPIKIRKECFASIKQSVKNGNNISTEQLPGMVQLCFLENGLKE